MKMKSLFILVVTAAGAGLQADLKTVKKISWQELADKINQSKAKPSHPLHVINVLPRDICRDCSIPGSINIPTHLLAQKLKKWPKDRKIVIYCAGGDCPLSKYASQTILSLGFHDVSVLDGGIRAWSQSMLPTVGNCKSGYLHG